jgi:hypothetical protein
MGYRLTDDKKRSRHERNVWVTHHAVKRFRQRVTNLPIRDSRKAILSLITSSVEVTPSERYFLEMPKIHRKPGVRYFRARYDRTQFIVVVCLGEDSKWVVLTVKPDNPNYFNLEGGKRHGQPID